MDRRPALSVLNLFFPKLSIVKLLDNKAPERKAYNPTQKIEKQNRRKALKRRAFLRQRNLHKNSRKQKG